LKGWRANGGDELEDAMDINLRSGRIVGPAHVVDLGGKSTSIPDGPCLLEQLDDDRVDVIWGESGQHSVVLSKLALETAAASGTLLLLGDPAQLVTGWGGAQSGARQGSCRLFFSAGH
jgi:hypothetical protein